MDYWFHIILKRDHLDRRKEIKPGIFLTDNWNISMDQAVCKQGQGKGFGKIPVSELNSGPYFVGQSALTSGAEQSLKARFLFAELLKKDFSLFFSLALENIFLNCK